MGIETKVYRGDKMTEKCPYYTKNGECKEGFYLFGGIPEQIYLCDDTPCDCLYKAGAESRQAEIEEKDHVIGILQRCINSFSKDMAKKHAEIDELKEQVKNLSFNLECAIKSF